MNVHSLRIILKIATGIHIEDEADYEIKELQDNGDIYKSQIGWDTSSTINRKIDRILEIWETL